MTTLEGGIIRHNYTLCAWVWNPLQLAIITSQAIAAEFDRRGEPWPAPFARLVRDGCRYSFEDFDVLGAIMHQLEKADPDAWRRLGSVVED